MTSSVEATPLDSSTCTNKLVKFEDLEFKWGKRRGIGGKRKEVQFYESFTYDGIEYVLHDCVYMHMEGEAEPYIGKLVKIWENGDKSKKVKIQWFFRPSEILYHLKDEKFMENEIFLASGEGIGLSNVNPLEAVTWFKELSWEERMQTANDQGRLVLLQNLDPGFTSAEVEDIIWHAFKEKCSAKMVQRTASSSPYSGQALAIFRTREAAERVIKKLNNRYLMVSNQRPVVADIIALPKSQRGASSFVGHLFIDKVRHQMQREMKEAVSTSHCSQPNTIEYEMAMEWRLLQSRSEFCWKRLYKQQREELRRVAANLKSK